MRLSSSGWKEDVVLRELKGGGCKKKGEDLCARIGYM